MVQWIKYSEYRANLDEYEQRAAGMESFVIKDDKDDVPLFALFPFEVYQQCARELAPKSINLLEMSHEDIRRIVDYEYPDDPQEGEIDYEKFKNAPEHYLSIAYFEPLLITVKRSRNWAVLSYEVLEQLYGGDRQALDELLKERPRLPPERDYFAERARAILKGLIRDPKALKGTEPPGEASTGEIDMDRFEQATGQYLANATVAPVLVTLNGARRWALLPYDLLKQLHSGDRQVLDELMAKRPRRRPLGRDYTDEETLAILEGRMRDPEELDEPDEPEEPQR